MRTRTTHKLTVPSNLFIVAGAVFVLASVPVVLEATGITNFINQPNTQTLEQKQEAEINSNNKQKLIESKPNNTDGVNANLQNHTSDDIGLSTHRETDGSVTILTQLKNYSDGTCDITIENGNNSYNQTASVIYQATFSTCAGFNIPINTLGYGTWQISLTVISKGKVNTNTISTEIKR
jgi:hypothetical protein